MNNRLFGRNHKFDLNRLIKFSKIPQDIYRRFCYGFDNRHLSIFCSAKEENSIPKVDNTIICAIGDMHGLIQTKDKLYGFGSNIVGQLGIGKQLDQNEEYMYEIPCINDIISMAVGWGHSLVVNIEGKVYGFGNNRSNQIALGPIKDSYSLQIISELDNIIQVAAGHRYSLFLTNDGRVYVCGDHYYNNDGLDHRKILKLIPELEDIIQISGKEYNSVALKSDGTVYYFGCSKIKSKDLKYKSISMPTPILSNIVSVAAGINYVLALSNAGLVYLYNSDGVSHIEQLTNVIQIAAGITILENGTTNNDIASALTIDGTLYLIYIHDNIKIVPY